MSARCELIAGRSFAKRRRDPAIFAGVPTPVTDQPQEDLMTGTSATAGEYLVTPNKWSAPLMGSTTRIARLAKGHPWSFFSISAATSTTGIPR